MGIKMNEFQNKLLTVLMAVMLLASMVYVGREAAAYVSGNKIRAGEEKKCVVIDAGHGGDEYRLKNKFWIAENFDIVL